MRIKEEKEGKRKKMEENGRIKESKIWWAKEHGNEIIKR